MLQAPSGRHSPRLLTRRCCWQKLRRLWLPRFDQPIEQQSTNFWRITLATIFLTVWAFTFGGGFAGAPGWFIVEQASSACGLGDHQAHPGLAASLAPASTVLLCQCLTALPRRLHRMALAKHPAGSPRKSFASRSSSPRGRHRPRPPEGHLKISAAAGSALFM